MKLAVLFLACVVILTSGYEIPEKLAERSISSEILNFIYAFQGQMPCGYPDSGIPPLAPIKAEHREINIKTEGLTLEGIVDRFRLYGLDGFEVKEFKVNAVRSKVDFNFVWDSIHLQTLYKMMMDMHGGTNLKMSRDGYAKLFLKDLKVWGTIKYSLGVISGNLRVKECSIYVSVGQVISQIENLSKVKIINRKLNEIIEETIMLAINDNTENIAELTNEIIVPIANDFIGDRSLTDIIAGIGGGGGNGDPVEKEECIPPVIPDF